MENIRMPYTMEEAKKLHIKRELELLKEKYRSITKNKIDFLDKMYEDNSKYKKRYKGIFKLPTTNTSKYIKYKNEKGSIKTMKTPKCESIW
jgi:hypothetical protein